MTAAEYDETTSLLFIDGKYSPVRVEAVDGVVFFDVETALALEGYDAVSWYELAPGQWVIPLLRTPKVS